MSSENEINDDVSQTHGVDDNDNRSADDDDITLSLMVTMS